MTLSDLVEEVQEKTHLGELGILDRVQRAWPSHQQFTPTQAALMVRAIQRDGQKERGVMYIIPLLLLHTRAGSAKATGRQTLVYVPGPDPRLFPD